MSELFSAVELEPAAGSRAGFRLERLEVLNWGTFDQQVARLVLGGENTLLTGDIGSGKSTLVDAVTTLLLPSQRISYNKAAGAETRERSLRSYVLGHYKSERNETSGSSRPIGLRDHRSYSVVLGVFRNEGHDADVTLAQVFWMRDTSQGQPQRFYVTAPEALSVADDLAGFGSDLGVLRRRLRERGATVDDTFPGYGRQARRLLGIASEQAMELFHQTVSMKSVGNLNDFVRHHMLEPADASTRVAQLVAHFEDLTRAHEAVRRAKDQLSWLEPLLVHCDRHRELDDAVRTVSARREALPFFFAEHRLGLLGAQADRLRNRLETVDADVERHEATWRTLDAERSELLLRRQGAGGDRIARLESLVTAEELERDKRRRAADEHATELVRAGLDPVDDATSFARRRAEVDQQLDATKAALAEVEGDLTELAVDQRALHERAKAVNAEIVSLRERRSNIPLANVQVRAALCAALGVPEGDLPFVGELVQVRPEHADWQGAAERVLRGFALSVLVPTEHYDAAAAWIDAHHLRARIVYYRVLERRMIEAPPEPSGEQVLADLLEVSQGRFTTWVHDQLARRAAHVCAESIDRFRHERRAVTRSGQVKSPDGRHEKDDRHAIDDHSRYVLGWSNQQKVDALLDQATAVNEQLGASRARAERLASERTEADGRRSALERLTVRRDWAEVDWRACVTQIARWQEERKQLEASSSELAQIGAGLSEVNEALERADGDRRRAQEERGAVKGQLDDVRTRSGRQQRVLEGPEALARAREAFDALAAAVGDLPDDEGECEAVERGVVETFTARIDADRRGADLAAQRAVAAMGSFRRQFPEHAGEMDDSVQAAGEYYSLRDRLVGDDLPRFEAEFKRQLNANTINDLAGFSAWLRRSAEMIHDRISTINGSLQGIDYNEGRYIRLEAQRTPNVEIKEFRDELRACTDDALAASDQYSEERFLRVKRILERFRGRESMTEADRQWTARVSDVRNWFTFAASERWRESDEEYEHYTDSDGKSGGQKEKLAYTILAASLAYQFKLEWGARRSRDFRFVVIDEAFGRGSDASTRYALDLFRRLGLQLLIVTPLQKVHVIEPYVSGVGFVENRSGERSRVQTLTIEAYAEQQAIARG